MADTNKVKFGFDECYYAVITEGQNGEITYGTPVRIPGAVNLSLDIEGSDPEIFWADNIAYWVSPSTNSGYSGDLEVAKIPDSFRTDVLGEVTDTKGMIVEDADAVGKQFALLARSSGDKNKVAHVWYNCRASRISTNLATTEETTTPQTDTVTITSIPATFNGRHLVKARVPADADAYENFFTQVQIPAFSATPNPPGEG